ncbi:ABC transporter ATP-binding protein [Paenibacillus hemerocallicola]|uniref:ABC transporter ATP-binding protein n=1 Tax=Paenibacillus hemerocallicola TaxID=1172614 RepID=UPI001FEB467E|nr:ABC transporter ATP-binding protein [Paenibacillus hemerocallicola]
MNTNSYASILRGVLPLFVRIWRDMPVLTAVWLAFPLLLGALVVPAYAAQKQLIDLFVGGVGRDWRDLLEAAWPALAWFTGAALLRVVITAWQNTADCGFRNRAALLVRTAVHERAVGVPLERMDDPGYYDRLQRAESVAGEELLGVLQNAFSLLRLLCELLGLLAVASIAGPVVGLVLAVVFSVSFLIRLESDIVKRRLNRDLTTAGRQSDYLRETIVLPETVRDMRIAGSIGYLIGKWNGGMRQSLELRGNANRREIRRGIVVSTVQIAGLFGTIAWMATQMNAGGITAGTLVIVLQAMRQAHGISGRAAFPVGKMYIQSAKIVDLAEFLKEPPMMSPQGNSGPLRKGKNGAGKRGERISAPVSAGSVAPGETGTIELSDVSYTYYGADEPALRDIRLTLRPGETVAIVGENGAGKSTLAKLLLGLYRPTCGKIAWDGTDYGDLDPALLRRSVSAVFQDFVRYETTLRDNVGIGLPDEESADESIRRALRVAGADRLESMPGGLDARVGLVSEGGRQLSGGQWQRLAIARAAVRDARLLVLDEPTAALDPQHETELYRSFRELAKGRTVLFVSHRLGWARYADRIVVLRDGRIVEEGSHGMLMAAGGDYASMFRAQAEWYRG